MTIEEFNIIRKYFDNINKEEDLTDDLYFNMIKELYDVDLRPLVKNGIKVTTRFAKEYWGRDNLQSVFEDYHTEGFDTNTRDDEILFHFDIVELNALKFKQSFIDLVKNQIKFLSIVVSRNDNLNNYRSKLLDSNVSLRNSEDCYKYQRKGSSMICNLKLFCSLPKIINLLPHIIIVDNLVYSDE